jgi:hypothetical protein
VRAPDGTWSASGAGHVAVWIDGQDSPLDRLP